MARALKKSTGTPVGPGALPAERRKIALQSSSSVHSPVIEKGEAVWSGGTAGAASFKKEKSAVRAQGGSQHSSK